ncbi:MAG: FkbM family methyltransferase [Clostridiales bacterium]|nr:FkbM family methyltransferase [Clostridiales bacterium]
MDIRSLLATPSVWDILKQSKKPILLYGTGNGADKVLDEMTRLDIKPEGVFVSDDFCRGQSFRGYTVKKLSDFEKAYGDFIIAVCFASCLDSVINNIKLISRRYEVVVPCVPVYGNEILNSDFIKKYFDKINLAYSILEDEKSRDVYYNAIKFQYTGKTDILFDIESDKDEAFDILNLGEHESYLDLGAYKGDTIDEFLHYSHQKYDTITAVEPNPKTYKKLCEKVASKSNTVLINAAVSDKCTQISLSTKQGRGSTQFCKKTDFSVAAVTVDQICKQHKCSYLKADIEGSEHDMLKGAQYALTELKPKLNIAAYHRCRDIFDIPIIIKQINGNYKIYMRKHKYVPCWDLNVYCV